MNSPDPPPIPDAPGLPPWVLAYADFDGQGAGVLDVMLVHPEGACQHQAIPPPRYRVGAGHWYPFEASCACTRGMPGNLPCVLETDSEAEALAEYRRQAELLRQGGREGE